MSTIPTLRTERLILSGHTSTDLGECLAMWADPTVTRFIGGKPFSEAEVWARLLRYVGHWALLGFGYWLIREAGSGRFVGEVGFADVKREITPAFEGAPEIGWALAPWAHGRGIATEAVSAVSAWGDLHFGARGTVCRTVCMISPENVQSIRVASKCGYEEYARTTYSGEPTILFQRL